MVLRELETAVNMLEAVQSRIQLPLTRESDTWSLYHALEDISERQGLEGEIIDFLRDEESYLVVETENDDLGHFVGVVTGINKEDKTISVFGEAVDPNDRGLYISTTLDLDLEYKLRWEILPKKK